MRFYRPFLSFLSLQTSTGDIDFLHQFIDSAGMVTTVNGIRGVVVEIVVSYLGKRCNRVICVIKHANTTNAQKRVRKPILSFIPLFFYTWSIGTR